MSYKVTVKETNIFFIMFLLTYVGLSTVVGMLLPEDVPYWLMMCISEMVIISPIIMIILANKLRLKNFMLMNSVGTGDVLLAYVGAYCLLPLIYLINFCSSFFTKNYVNDMMADINAYPLWAQLVLMAVLPAVVEEFIFRGFFYGHYRKKHIVGAAILSGLFFGIAHMNLNQFAYAFVIGVAFCLLYEASGNILIPVTAHFAINANSVFLMQLLNMADENVVEEAAVVAANASGMQEQTYVYITIAVLIFMSLVFTTIFVGIVEKIAKRNDRTQYFVLDKKDKAAVMNRADVCEEEPRECADEKFMDMYLFLAVVPPIIYMIALEML